MKTKMPAVIWFVFAVICIAYGVTVKAAGSGTRFFLVWIAFGVLFILAGVSVWTGMWGRTHTGVRRFIVCVVLVLCVVIAVLSSLVFSRFSEKGEKNLDYIIVLGAQVYARGPSPVLKYRLDAAAAYLNENPDTLCIVTGGQGYNEPLAEAEGMADYLEKEGIAPERIIKETESLTTVQNLVNTMKLVDLNGKSVGIVTSNFHVYRALGIAKKLGITDCCGIAAASNPVYLPNNVFRECLGIVKELVTGSM